MYCYVLQGVLGVLALAAIIAGVIGFFLLLIKGGDWMEDRVTVPSWMNYVLETIAVLSLSVLLSIGVWCLGGSLLKQFFHFCVR